MSLDQSWSISMSTWLYQQAYHNFNADDTSGTRGFIVRHEEAHSDEGRFSANHTASKITIVAISPPESLNCECKIRSSRGR